MATSEEKAFLKRVFGAGTPLDYIAWRGDLEALADGAPFVDLVVSSVAKPIARTYNIAAVFAPSGLIAKPMQTYQLGFSQPLPRIPVPTGQELWIVANSPFYGLLDMELLAVNVQVVPVGSGQSTADREQPKDPLTEGAKALGSGLGFGLVALFGLWLLSRKL